MIQTNLSYTEPIVCTADAKDWYIYFEYYHNGKWHKRKLREGINRIKDRKLRRKEADILAEQRLLWLKEGWNPVIDPEFKLRSITPVSGIKTMLFNDAMDFPMLKKKLAKKTRQDYENMLEYVKKSATKYGHSLLQIYQITRLHIFDLLSKMSKDYSWSNHRYNSYLATIVQCSLHWKYGLLLSITRRRK